LLIKHSDKDNKVNQLREAERVCKVKGVASAGQVGSDLSLEGHTIGTT
jgi:hypothetical protein